MLRPLFCRERGRREALSDVALRCISTITVVTRPRCGADDHVDDQEDAKRKQQSDGIRYWPSVAQDEDDLGDYDNHKKGDQITTA